MQQDKFPWILAAIRTVTVVEQFFSAVGAHFSRQRPLYHLHYLVDEPALFDIETRLEWMPPTSFSYFLLDGSNVSASIIDVQEKTNKAADHTVKMYIIWYDGLTSNEVRSNLDELYTNMGHDTPHYWYIINAVSNSSSHCPSLHKNDITPYVDHVKCKAYNLPCTPIWQHTHPNILDFEQPCFVDSVVQSAHSKPLHNQHLRVGTAIWYPFVGYRKDRNPPYYGICIELLEYIASKTGFTYTLVEPADGYWGGKVNGSWTGLVGLLERKEVDIVVAPLSNIPQRYEVMEFVDQPFYIDHTTVMFMTEAGDDLPSSALLKPLSPEVWIAIPCAWILVAIVVWFVQCLEYGIRKRDVLRSDLRAAFWDIFSVFTMQGLTNFSRYRDRPASKIILVFTWLCAVILAAAYAANLVAFLAVPTNKLPFSNVEEMLAQNQYKFGLVRGSSQELTFRNSSVPVFQKVWNQIEAFARHDPSVLSRNYAEHYEKVKKEKYAMIVEETEAHLGTKELNKCVLKSLSNPFGLTEQFAVGLQKHSSWSILFSDIITETRSNGLIEFWVKKHFGSTEVRCPKLPVKDSVKLHHVFYICCGLFAVLGVAILMLVGERMSLQLVCLLHCR